MALPDDSPAPWKRYVVQHHTGCGADHFDLMLQHGDALWTWQMNAPLTAAASGSQPARRIADHRLAYLTYEGPISRDRGQCRIVDAGRVRWLDVSPTRLRFELADGQIGGPFELALIDAAEGLWQLTRTGDAGPA